MDKRSEVRFFEQRNDDCVYLIKYIYLALGCVVPDHLFTSSCYFVWNFGKLTLLYQST